MTTTDSTGGAPAQDYDVVVVGGGAAGLSGALALSRARRSVLVVDGGEPRNAPAAGVHNYLGREGVPPAELLATGRAEVSRYGGQVTTGTVIGARRRTDPDAPGPFEVELGDGRRVGGRRLLVTTGVVDELPAVPGLAERWGRDVLHCPYCHGWEVRDQEVGILGTGPLAVHAALLWRQWTGRVTLFLHSADAPTEQQHEQLAARDVTVVAGRVDALVVEADRLQGLRLDDGRTVPVQAVVVTTHLSARSDLLAQLGLPTTELRLGEHVVGSRVETGVGGATDLPGVYAAGNVTDPLAQVVGCAAAGLAAAAAINADLVGEDTARAVAARAAASRGPAVPAARPSPVAAPNTVPR